MPLKLKRYWIAIGLAFVALVIYLSLTPDPPDTGVPQGMKIGHVLAYAWLMFWFAQVYRSNKARYRLAAAFCCMGIGLEYLQGMTGYRGFEYSDMVINSAGVAVGLLLARSRLQDGLTTLEAVILRR